MKITPIDIRDISVALGAVLMLGPSVWAEPESPAAPTAVQVRRAVEHGLPFLATGVVGWNRSYTCVMCHHQPMMIWACNEARSRGIRVDDKKVREWSDRTWNQVVSPKKPYLLPEPDEKSLVADGVPADSELREPRGLDDLRGYWSTAWAVIGLARTLPRPSE